MKKKLVFIVDGFIYGGITVVLLNYLNAIDKEKYDVDVIILTNKVEDIVEKIPEYCTVKTMNFSRLFCPFIYWRLAIRYNWGAVIYPILHTIVRFTKPYFLLKMACYGKYDVAIAFSGHINDLYMAGHLVNSKKKVAWLHGSLIEYIAISPAFEKLYHKFDKLVVLNQFGQASVSEARKWVNYAIKIEKILNPISVNGLKDTVDEDRVTELKNKYGDYILMVARIDRQSKDHKTLIDAVERLHAAGFNKNLVFVGDGPDREMVENYVIHKGLTNWVYFEGNRSDVANYYISAWLYVLSSHFEGLPTVVFEAMVFGLPVVATDCPFGPLEILGNNEYGLLCRAGDSANMTEKIVAMMNEQLYMHYVEKGYERLNEVQPRNIIKKFDDMIESMH